MLFVSNTWFFFAISSAATVMKVDKSIYNMEVKNVSLLRLQKLDRSFLPFYHRIQGSLDWSQTNSSWHLWAYDVLCYSLQWMTVKCRFRAISSRKWRWSSSRLPSWQRGCFSRVKRRARIQTLDFYRRSSSCSSRCAPSNLPAWKVRKDIRSQTDSCLWILDCLRYLRCVPASAKCTCRTHRFPS